MAPRSAAPPVSTRLTASDAGGPIDDRTLVDLTHGDDAVYPFESEASSASVRAASGRGSGRSLVGERRRRWPKRLAILAIVLGLLGGGLYAAQRIYLHILFNRIQTVPVADGTFDALRPAAKSPDPTPQTSPTSVVARSSAGPDVTAAPGGIPAVSPTAAKAPGGKGAGGPAAAKPATAAFGPLVDTSGVAAVAADDPDAMNLLMIGVDSRANIPKNQCDTFGCDKVGTGSRSDTIMIARISPKYHSIDLLSIPRDLWVRLARTGKWSKINAAYVAGATSLISTLQANLNVPINHLVEVDFVGFEKLVRAVGGVELCFDHQTRDKVTGLDQAPGCHTVGDVQAIAYVRSRHYEQLGDDGKWHTDPSSDFGRIRRQQLFIRSTMVKTLAQAKSNPIRFDQLLAAVPGAVRIDNTFSFGEVQQLAGQFKGFDPNNLHTATVPAKGARVGKEDVLKIDTAKAPAVIGRFGRRS